MTTKRFSYGILIQPSTGQELVEYPGGVELRGARRLTTRERRQNPNHDRQIYGGVTAVITDDREILFVPSGEI